MTYGGDAPIRVTRVTHVFPGGLLTLNDVTLHVEGGEFVSIVGPSGCGKTTLLNLIAGLVEVQEGNVAVANEPPRAGRRDVAYMLARDCLFPWRSALGNVMVGGEFRRVPTAERRKRARDFLEKVGLHGFENHYPKALSHGMRQRVALARTFCLDSPILLMDEPFSALDPLIREEMQQELLRLQSTLNKTIVFVTHDPNEAATIGDHVAILLKGKVAQQGSPREVVLSPANDYVRDFVRSVDIFKVLSAGQIVDTGRAPIILGGPAVSPLAIGQASSGSVAVTDSSGRLLGIVARPSTLGTSPTEWESRLSQDFVKLAPDTLVAPFLAELSGDDRPLVVERSDGTFVGMITRSSLLRTLASYSSVTGKQAMPETRQPRPDMVAAEVKDQYAGAPSA